MAHEWRVIELDGVHNFRDYGGYPVSGGGRLRRGLLWRSGQHHAASDADLARIAALDLDAVFDLRFDAERASHPCRRPPGFAGRVFFAEEVANRARHDADRAADAGLAAEVKAAPHLSAAVTALARDAAAMRTTMANHYTSIPFRSSLVAAMRGYLAELAQIGAPGPARPGLVHCMAGKDRTGVAVALLHHAVGVHRDDIMADYLLTNTAGDVEARIVAGGQILQSHAGPIAPEALRVLMSVEPEYLDTAFAAIIERHGSMDAYLAEVLGADAALKERLRERLVI